MNPAQELDGASPPDVTANLMTGLNIDEYFSRTDSAGPATLLADALGSTIGLTNMSGALDTTYTYEPFGNVTISGSANGNSFQFTGRENDVCVANCYLSPGSTICPHKRSAQEHLRNRKRPDC